MTSALFDLTGRQAVVTGGAQGLGRMIAEGLLAAGAAVAITSRNAETAESAAREMAPDGRCVGYGVDLSTPEAAAGLADRVAVEIGSCHILVNNAGKTWGAPLEDFPDKAWASVMATNVQAPFTLVRQLLPLLRAGASPQNPTRVINIGSVAGMRPERLNAYSYAASKAAIHMLTRDLACDLAADNITVNALVPGFFPTRMTAHMRDAEVVDPGLIAHIPLARLGSSDDIAGAAVFLASRAASYVTGIALPVDGGIIGAA
jgi:NAD(P)-dependent dehydrogenase (short-subunit alcohol dehydrogenase family)